MLPEILHQTIQQQVEEGNELTPCVYAIISSHHIHWIVCKIQNLAYNKAGCGYNGGGDCDEFSNTTVENAYNDEEKVRRKMKGWHTHSSIRIRFGTRWIFDSFNSQTRKFAAEEIPLYPWSILMPSTKSKCSPQKQQQSLFPSCTCAL